MSIQDNSNMLSSVNELNKVEEDNNRIPYSLLENINSLLKDELDEMNDILLTKEIIIKERNQRITELEKENRILKNSKKPALNQMYSQLSYNDRNKLAYGDKVKANGNENNKKRKSGVIVVSSDEEEGWKPPKESKEMIDEEEFLPPKQSAGGGSLSLEWFILDIFLRSNKKDERGRRCLAKCKYCQCIIKARETCYLRDHVVKCFNIPNSTKEIYSAQVAEQKKAFLNEENEVMEG
jgi:hypothetical protein